MTVITNDLDQLPFYLFNIIWYRLNYIRLPLGIHGHIKADTSASRVYSGYKKLVLLRRKDFSEIEFC